FDGVAVYVEGRPSAPRPADVAVVPTMVSNGYRRTMGMRLLEGRDFEGRDNEEHVNVIVVNKTMARQFFPGKSAVGRRVRLSRSGPMVTIIGVVDNNVD